MRFNGISSCAASTSGRRTVATRSTTGAVEAYGWLWSCCEDVEKGRRAMLSLVLDPLSEYGCDFFGFLVFICTYPRGTFFFSPHSPISLWIDSGPPARHWLTYGFVLESRDGSVGWDPRGRKSKYLGITSRATFASEDTKRRDDGLEQHRGFGFSISAATWRRQADSLRYCPL